MRESPTLADNKAVVRRFVDEVLNAQDPHAVDQLVAEDFVEHGAAPGALWGREGLKRTLAVFLDSFRDLRVAIEDMVAEGDKVVVRTTTEATYVGDPRGIVGVDRRVSFTSIEIIRLSGGRIVERWATAEHLSLLQQLGAVLTRGRAG